MDTDSEKHSMTREKQQTNKQATTTKKKRKKEQANRKQGNEAEHLPLSPIHTSLILTLALRACSRLPPLTWKDSRVLCLLSATTTSGCLGSETSSTARPVI